MERTERKSSWDVVLLALNCNVTIAGKVWLILVVLLRGLVLLFASYPLYQDEQERFACNTIQPGCTGVCYDVFAPLSLLRFWLLQLVALCIPYVTYLAYVAHRVLSDLAEQQGGHQLLKLQREATINKTHLERERNARHTFRQAYLLQLCARTLLEAGFMTGHCFIFGLSVSKSFFCYEVPCTSMVECYVSRPTEKTLMVNFMLVVSALCLLVNIADLVCTSRCGLWHKQGRRTSKSSSESPASVSLDSSDFPPVTPDSQKSPKTRSSNESSSLKKESQLALCLNKPVEGTQPAPSNRNTHLRPPLSPKSTKALIGGPKVFSTSTRQGEQFSPVEDCRNHQCDREVVPERRAWV